jgi:tetratricopeptide (TPR) repeat protein
MNSMSSDPIHMHEERMSVLQKHIGPEPPSGSASSSIVHKAYGRVYFKTAIEYFQRGDLDKLAFYLKKSVNSYPSLLAELDTFYELGVGDQPKGQRGHFASIDLARSERMVDQLLSSLLAEVTAARPYRRAAYAQFHYALGLLYYGAHQPDRARRHLLKSLSYRPGRLSEQRWWSTLFKSLLPSRWMEALRSTLAKRPRIL